MARLSRRTFVRSSLAGAALVTLHAPLAAARGLATERTLEEVVERALAAARRAGASYADVRVVRRRAERVEVRDAAVAQVLSTEEYGLGVRVIVDGAWGVAASARVQASEAVRAARQAVAVARAHAALRRAPVVLAPEPAHVDVWQTPLVRHPFKISLEDKAELLLEVGRRALAAKRARFYWGAYEGQCEWKLLATSEGARIEQEIVRVAPRVEVTAIDERSGTVASRKHDLPPRQGGWEYIEDAALAAAAPRLAEEAAEKARAPVVTPGRYDLVIDPSNLWLTIHETIGHATELDRALGMEANFAGTSYATPDQLGKLRIGSPHVTVYADRLTPGGLATSGYDDDGVPAQRWDLVRHGVLVGFQTTREQAGWIGQARSTGTCYAQGYGAVPFQRMPNVSLAPGPAAISLEDLIADTQRGLLVVGDGSWSIDQQRRSFQFGGQLFWEIEGGKRRRMVRDAAYTGSSIAFWQACDAVGGEASWRLGGALHDGKGEPVQLNPMSHGAPPVRVRGVDVLATPAGRP